MYACLRRESAFGLTMTMIFDLWPLTYDLKTFQAMATNMAIIFGNHSHKMNLYSAAYSTEQRR